MLLPQQQQHRAANKTHQSYEHEEFMTLQNDKLSRQDTASGGKFGEEAVSGSEAVLSLNTDFPFCASMSIACMTRKFICPFLKNVLLKRTVHSAT